MIGWIVFPVEPHGHEDLPLWLGALLLLGAVALVVWIVWSVARTGR